MTHDKLTWRQRAELERLADTSPNAKVVGWDTAIQGPLVKLTNPTDPPITAYLAISPRGKRVARKPPKEQVV